MQDAIRTLNAANIKSQPYFGQVATAISLIPMLLLEVRTSVVTIYFRTEFESTRFFVVAQLRNLVQKGSGEQGKALNHKALARSNDDTAPGEG